MHNASVARSLHIVKRTRLDSDTTLLALDNHACDVVHIRRREYVWEHAAASDLNLRPLTVQELGEDLGHFHSLQTDQAIADARYDWHGAEFVLERDHLGFWESHLRIQHFH